MRNLLVTTSPLERHPGIDVLSVHDYYGSVPLGGDQWNGMAVRFAQAKALNKPIITGEVGIEAGSGQSGCESLQQRALDMSAKMTAPVRRRRQWLSRVELGPRPARNMQRQHRPGRQFRCSACLAHNRPRRLPGG